jgi:hypothetical protein
MLKKKKTKKKMMMMTKRQIKMLVDSWVEFYEKITEYLYNLDTERFRELYRGVNLLMVILELETTMTKN